MSGGSLTASPRSFSTASAEGLFAIGNSETCRTFQRPGKRAFDEEGWRLIAGRSSVTASCKGISWELLGAEAGHEIDGMRGQPQSILQDTGEDFPELLRKLAVGSRDRALGQASTRDRRLFPRRGRFWWKRAIAYPVEEITIAGNLKEMFLGLAAAGPMSAPGSRQCGSILIERMTIAGD